MDYFDIQSTGTSSGCYSGGQSAMQAMLNSSIQQQQMQNAYMQGLGNLLGSQQAMPRQSQKTVTPQPTKQPEKKSMFKEIATDIKGFILEHRGVIYFIAFALILDHFIFKGAFKVRLQSMADKVVAKVEEKIK